MGKLAFLFSGQGAQYPGMGSDFYNNLPFAKELFDKFELHKIGNKELCFNGTKEDLAQTKNTQPCLYTVDLVAALSLKERGIVPDVVAGFSLGELAALSFADVMSYEEGFKIVCKRGEFMQSAGEERKSVMIAVLKLDTETVETVCNKFKEVYPVNYNYSGQTVVSSSLEESEDFKEAVKEAGGRAMILPVSGGFHSPFMASAKFRFKTALNDIEFKPLQIPVYSNYTSELYGDDVADYLIKQMMNPVRWQNIVENMINDGVDTFIEVGVGKTLSGFVSRISKEAKVYNVEDMESLENTVMEVNGC